jgi:signal recognition particle receptor subunit beta
VSTVNPIAREISAKIVYYGPGLSGKTTTLQHVHQVARPDARGDLISLATEGDRTLFFDFLPLKLERVRGLALRLQLYTVPGQVFYDATRKLVLNGADGVVFVADSQPLARDSNLESMDNLARNLAEQGIDLAHFPLVLQYNKRDLPEVMPVAHLREDLNPRGAPDFESVASRGVGVLDALRAITRLVVKDLESRQPHRRPPAADPARGAGPEGAPTRPAPASPPGPLSMARLFEGNTAALEAVERAIGEGRHGAAVRAAADALAAILDSFPVPGEAPAARATLLGLDGREFLRLSRIAARPEAEATERDALFALHLLVAARLKAERV